MASPADKNKIIEFAPVQGSAGGSGTGGVPPTNLPTPATAFIGRAAQVGEVVRLIADEDVRILTLTGPGGVGKTRLAVKACERLLPGFEHGVFFVSLASIMEPGLAVPAIANTLGLKESGSTKPADALADFLQDKDMLLLLDNFEQVASAGPSVTRLLANAPGVRLMITSRTALHLYGEYDWQVPPMDLPDDTGIVKAGAATTKGEDLLREIGGCEAIQLFVARGKEVRPGFALTADNARDVAEICRRLDGLPLALELAAARLRIFSPQSLLKRLDKVLPMLVEGARDLPDRQRTLRNAIEWSYNLLDENERRLFALMSVFLGGCTIEAVQHVWNDMYRGGTREKNEDGDAGGEIVRKLESLVAQNLVRQREQDDGESRFWMLATIREYGLEKLTESKLREQAQDAHARFFLALSEAGSAAHALAKNNDEWLRRTDRDFDNMRTALSWSSERGDAEVALRITVALVWYWTVRGYFVEAAHWLDDVLAKSEGLAPGLRADAFWQAGWLAMSRNDFAHTKVFAEESLKLYQEIGDRKGIAKVLSHLGIVAAEQEDYPLALSRFGESIEVWRELDHRTNVAMLLGNLCFLAQYEGDFKRAISYGEESLELQRTSGSNIGITGTGINLGLAYLHSGNYAAGMALHEEMLAEAEAIGSKRDMALAHTYLGLSLLLQGKPGDAAPHYRESLRIFEEIGNQFGVGRSLLGLAGAATAEGRYREGAVLSEAAHNLIEEARGKPVPAERGMDAHAREEARKRLGEGAFGEALRQGRGMSRAEGIEVALGRRALPVLQHPEPVEIRPTEPVSAQSGEITARELEVLRLITAGLTNKEIGERLVLSHRTVQAHLYRIFSKLNVTTRTAATRYAIEHGLA